jgi:hypothetical protein
MKKHFKYFIYLLKHKFWATYYCFKEGLIWQGLLHDWSKFLPDEWFPYANYFYGKKGEEVRKKRRESGGYYKPYATGNAKFDLAWLKHQKRNRHHWQWWILPEDDGGTFAMPMQKRFIIEMICDWRGAGRAQGYGENTPEWYMKNKNKMILHTDTRFEVEFKLLQIFGDKKMHDALEDPVQNLISEKTY